MSSFVSLLLDLNMVRQLVQSACGISYHKQNLTGQVRCKFMVYVFRSYVLSLIVQSHIL